MGAQDNDFSSEFSLNLNGELHELNAPWVMGICNLNADSFYAKSRVNAVEELVDRCNKMLEEGAKLIDIGVASSRPGAKLISSEEEIDVLSKYLPELRREIPKIKFSVDTYNAKTAAFACENGACIINDISGGLMDGQMLQTVANCGVPFIAMHMQGTPENMQNNPEYRDVVSDIYKYLSERIVQCHQAGINDVLIDPGFGFGKTIKHNYELLNKLNYLTSLDTPIVVGLSRKSMLYKPLGSSANEALNATTAAHIIALERGANMLRVHDVKEAVEAVRIFQMVKS